jgi:hypothetical protein
MKLTNKMIDTLDEKIKTGLEKEILKPVTICIIRVNNKIAVIIPLQENLLTEAILEKLDIISYLNRYTNLIWEKEGDKIFLKSGYVMFYDECDGVTLEQYNIIEGDEFHSPILYMDGKQNHTCLLQPYPLPDEGYPCDWEPNNDWFEFKKELPDKKR